MTLIAYREQTLSKLHTGAGEEEILKFAKLWFEAYKVWEKEETFDRALADGRMTARTMDYDKKVEFDVYDEKRETSSRILLNQGMTGVIPRLDPQNFLDKKKNELGLHDLSTVLLQPSGVISKQIFISGPNKMILFMPIPLEEDIQLFEELSQVAKRNREGDLYKFVVDIRAKMTRIKYGSEDDMHVGFLKVTKSDGKDHFRYGGATITGKVYDPELLKQRSVSALHYKSKIIGIKGKAGNNEVTLKVRYHAGKFPVAGTPGPIKKNPQVPFDVAKDDYLLATTNELIGILSDDGKLTPVPGK